MKITFISNYINHHQIPLANELYKRLGMDYRFIQTENMEEDRIKMGWATEVNDIPYVLNYSKEKEVCDELLVTSDVVIVGGIRDEACIMPRLEKGLFTIRYSERIYKEAQWKRFSPRGLVQKYHDFIRFRKKPYYLFCAGGYVADDYDLIKAFPNKMFKWGYFPQSIKYDIDDLLQKKETKSKVVLLWTGRMIDWKHPEYAVQMAKRLKDKGYDFVLKMIGQGEMRESLENLTQQLGVQEEVVFLDFMAPSDVRKQMEEADIYLITSDRNEGWGAVVNEAMNSGCVVIAGHMIGAAPYLIKHGENGLVFETENIDSLQEEVEKVINNKCYRKKMGVNAYKTIDTLWNPKVAAERLLEFCTSKQINAYAEGPGARENPVRERKMYSKMKEK